jgi:hypothetical protein
VRRVVGAARAGGSPASLCRIMKASNVLHVFICSSFDMPRDAMVMTAGEVGATCTSPVARGRRSQRLGGRGDRRRDLSAARGDWRVLNGRAGPDRVVCAISRLRCDSCA